MGKKKNGREKYAEIRKTQERFLKTGPMWRGTAYRRVTRVWIAPVSNGRSGLRERDRIPSPSFVP